MTHLWERAIVMGGGVAGLVTARVLSDFFREVVLVERDPPPDGPHPRPGVPQAHHIHTLLARGRLLLDKLYPGFDDDLAAQGILLYSWGKDTHILTTGGYLRRADLGIQARGHSRAMLEWVLRCRTEQLSNIRVQSGCTVTGLLVEQGTALGIKYQDAHEHELKADFIVDALGRNSPTIAWLEALGYPAPPETSVNPWMGYATRWYQLRPGQALDVPGVLIQPGVQPGLNRGAAAGRIEDRQVIITLLGMSRDYPPTDEVGFAEFARSLPDDTIQRWIETLEPISPIYGYRAVNRQRHFERLKRYPERLIILGDASCALNPIYGQGMSVAAMQADMLHDHLAQVTTLDDFARRFHRRLAHVNRIPWLLATSEDRRYPQTEGTPPNVFERLMHRYIARLFRAASYDSHVARALLKTMQLIMHPAGLFHPLVVVGALRPRGNQRRTRSEALSTGDNSHD